MTDKEKTASSLEIRGVTKRFGGICAVNDIHIAVAPGSIHGIIGPNGAGKTTMFNLITGIYQPTEGQILISGRDITGKSPHQIARLGVARTFQNIRLFGELSVYENIITACQDRLSYSAVDGCLRTPKFRRQEAAIARLAEEILESLGLWELREHRANNLPYGQQRRLEIARALATDPCLLLLDEPAAGMNEEESYQLSQFVKKIRKEYRVTIVLIDHHMDVIMDTCDRITVFNFGTKLAEGSPEQIQENPAVIEAYLGVDEPC